MAQQKVVQLPAFVVKLLGAIEQRFPGCETDAEPINGGDNGNYRIAVVSREFEGVPIMDRYDLVADVLKQVLDFDDRYRIFGILTLTPKELEGEE